MTQSPIPLSRFDLPRLPRRAARRFAFMPLVKADASNPAASAITARYAYDGFGRAVAVSGADAEKNAFRFSTKQLDAETGMNYYGHRYYNPNFGRWISRDLLKEMGGHNVYSFCSNSTLALVDIIGDCPSWLDELIQTTPFIPTKQEAKDMLQDALSGYVGGLAGDQVPGGNSQGTISPHDAGSLAGQSLFGSGNTSSGWSPTVSTGANGAHYFGATHRF